MSKHLGPEVMFVDRGGARCRGKVENYAIRAQADERRPFPLAVHVINVFSDERSMSGSDITDPRTDRQLYSFSEPRNDNGPYVQRQDNIKYPTTT